MEAVENTVASVVLIDPLPLLEEAPSSMAAPLPGGPYPVTNQLPLLLCCGGKEWNGWMMCDVLEVEVDQYLWVGNDGDGKNRDE